MRNEDYISDFLLISRRHLTPLESDIFRFHFLLGADWKLCTRRLGLDRGNFFHAVYRIQQKLGRAFAETKPYGLYPLDEYFGLVIDHAGKPPTKALHPVTVRPPALRPPVSSIA